LEEDDKVVRVPVVWDSDGWPMVLNYAGFGASGYLLGSVFYEHYTSATFPANSSTYDWLFTVPICAHYFMRSFGWRVNPDTDKVVYDMFSMLSLIFVDPIGLTLFKDNMIAGQYNFMSGLDEINNNYPFTYALLWLLRVGEFFFFEQYEGFTFGAFGLSLLMLQILSFDSLYSTTYSVDWYGWWYMTMYESAWMILSVFNYYLFNSE